MSSGSGNCLFNIEGRVLTTVMNLHFFFRTVPPALADHLNPDFTIIAFSHVLVIAFGLRIKVCKLKEMKPLHINHHVL